MQLSAAPQDGSGRTYDNPLYRGSTGSDGYRDWANGIIGNAPSVGNPAGYERADAVSAVVLP